MRSVVVVDRCGTDVEMKDGRDHWWHDLVAAAAPECEPVPVDSEREGLDISDHGERAYNY